MDPWVAELRRGRIEEAWDLFLERYRRLILAAIRHYADDYDDVMDVFARVCEALRAEQLRRLRTYADAPVHRARFSTWLVTVVRNLTVDWFRHRDGRRRLSRLAETLPPIRRRIFQLVFLDQHSHIEAYEVIRSGDHDDLSFGQFLVELRETYRAVVNGRRGRLLRELGHPPTELPAGEDSPDQEWHDELEEALCRLPPEDRLVLELYVVEGMAADAVAKLVGWADAKAVYNRVYRTLAAMRQQLEQAGVRREDR